jgi:hypothetical protein
MADIEYYNLIQQHFGFDHGRYISADVKKWAREAMQIVKASDIEPVKRHSVKNYLNKIFYQKCHEEFYLAKDRTNISEENWENWWNKQTVLRSFSSTISKSRNNALKIDDINKAHPDWVVPRSMSVSKTPFDILSALEPMLKISDELTLIDQYYLLNENLVLKELLTQSQGYSISSITIVSSINPKDPHKIYAQQYQILNAKSIKFKWILAPDKFFHDRYFISNIGAIRSGQGFSKDIAKGAHSDSYKFNIIGKDEANDALMSLENILIRGIAKIVFET